jgi:hypothetical protein
VFVLCILISPIRENITPIGDGNLALSVFPDAKTLFNIRENITLIGDGN